MQSAAKTTGLRAPISPSQTIRSGEFLAELAMRRRDIVLGRTQKIARENLRRLGSFMSEHQETIGWIPPRGGMTAFPWLLSGEDSRDFCQAAAERGILLAPGDCFDAPAHFRLGFAAIDDGFSDALNRLGDFVRNWSATTMQKALA